MPDLADVAAMGVADAPGLDARFAAALSLQAAVVLSQRPDETDMETRDRLMQSQRRTFAWTVLKDPVGVSRQARWVLAAAPLPLLDAYLAGGEAAIPDEQLRQAAEVLWDYLAEA